MHFKSIPQAFQASSTFPQKNHSLPCPLPPRPLFKTNSMVASCLVQVEEAAAAAKSLQSCPTLCDPIDSSPLGSSIPGILQARTLEWVAISFSNA